MNKKPFISKLKYYKLVVINRIATVKKYILFPAILFFCSILIIDLVLKEIPANSKFQYDLGQIYLKLCYSYTSAFMFYFLVVHLPKEKKKVKAFRFINNKTHQVSSEIGNLIETISDISKVKIDKENSPINIYEEACKKLNPNVGFHSSVEFNSHFDNWKEYLFFKCDRIKKIINDLMILNEAIDAEFLELLTLIEDDLSMHIIQRMRALTYLPTLTVISYSLFEIVKNSYDLKRVLQKKYGRYAEEFHSGARIRNVQRGLR